MTSMDVLTHVLVPALFWSYVVVALWVAGMLAYEYYKAFKEEASVWAEASTGEKIRTGIVLLIIAVFWFIILYLPREGKVAKRLEDLAGEFVLWEENKEPRPPKGYPM